MISSVGARPKNTKALPRFSLFCLLVLKKKFLLRGSFLPFSRGSKPSLCRFLFSRKNHLTTCARRNLDRSEKMKKQGSYVDLTQGATEDVHKHILSNGYVLDSSSSSSSKFIARVLFFPRRR